MKLKRAGIALALVGLGALVGGGSATAAKLITGKQIKDRSITVTDLALSARPRAGIRGPEGPPGGLSAIRQVESAPVAYGPISAGAGAVGAAQAQCPSGTTLVGGGYKHVPGGATSIAATVAFNAPSAPSAWGVVVINNFDEGDEIVAVAQCAAAAARSPRVAAPAAEGFARRVAALRGAAERASPRR